MSALNRLLAALLAFAVLVASVWCLLALTNAASPAWLGPAPWLETQARTLRDLTGNDAWAAIGAAVFAGVISLIVLIAEIAAISVPRRTVYAHHVDYHEGPTTEYHEGPPDRP
jgi:hypothetical protein